MIYAYLRLSTSEDKQKNSYEVQLKEIKKQFNIEKVFKESVSGSAKLQKRKALLDLIETIEKDDQVIVLRLDRLSRDTIQSGWIRYEIERKGAELITLENQSKDKTAKLIENILLAFAQYEKETTIWRIKKALDNKRSKGEALGGGLAKYGYDFVYVNGKRMLIKNPTEQQVIKRVARFRNKSAAQIAKILAADGALGKSGKPLERKQVQRILNTIAFERVNPHKKTIICKDLANE